VVFSNETATGWQQANLPTPVTITANTTYVVSYHAPVGRYAVNTAYFTGAVVNAPLRALASGADGGNGVYKHGASGFPTQTYNANNYWVDVVFNTTITPDTTPPTVSGRSPGSNATNVPTGAAVTATFSEAMDAATINPSSFELRTATGTTVAAVVSYDHVANTATLTPSNPLIRGTTYTATVKSGTSGVKDVAGNALAADVSWTFTTVLQFQCPCRLWNDAPTPIGEAAPDPAANELGVKFQAEVNGFITAIRFYKGPGNNGPHYGHLWDSSGTLLASVLFTNETATGWQQMELPIPIGINANTTYVASYSAPEGHYAFNPQYFSTALTNSPLRALASSEGGNGVYAYGGGFPTQTYNANNYWVDIVFTTTP
jgi:hypothetical protein